MARILVTGAAGLIGGAVAERLRSEGREVVGVDIVDRGGAEPGLRLAPLEDLDRLQAAVGPGQLAAIVHCGAISGPMLAKGDPQAIIRSNMIGLTNVVALALEYETIRLVFCSSVSVYGNASGGPGPERQALSPTSLYGASKAAGEALLTGFAAEYGLSAISLRIARVYGPGRRGNCLIKTAIERYQAGETAEIPCDPAFVYHYVYIDDVVDAIAAAMATPWTGHGVFNISGPRPQTMPEIVEDLRAALPGADIRMVPGVDDVPDVQHWFDLEAARAALAWTPKRSIVEGARAYASHLARVKL